MSVLGRCIRRSLVPVCGLLIRFSTVQNTHVIHVDYVAPLNIKRNGISCCIIMNAIQSINLTACDWGQAWVTLERPETGKRTPRALEDDFAVRTMEQWAGERRVLIFITEAILFKPLPKEVYKISLTCQRSSFQPTYAALLASLRLGHCKPSRSSRSRTGHPGPKRPLCREKECRLGQCGMPMHVIIAFLHHKLKV